MGSSAHRSFPAGVRQLWDDPPGIVPAAVLVGLAGAARGVGEWRSGGPEALLASTAVALLLWGVAGAVVATLSGFFAPRRVAVSRVLRSCALASAPALLLAVGVVPLSGQLQTALWVAVHFAMTGAFVVAVKRALAVDTTRALFLSVATFVVALLGVLTLQALLARPPAL